MKRILLGGIAGGFVLFVWSSIYWAASGIPIRPIKTFKSEAAVEAALRENASEPGYYVLPTPHVGTQGSAPTSEQATQRMNKIATSFFFAGAVQPGGVGGLEGQLGLSFLGNVLSAALMTFLLGFVRGATYPQRVVFCVAGGVFAWLVANYPLMVWWGYPFGYVLIYLFDMLVGWSLAGLVLARITREA